VARSDRTAFDADPGAQPPPASTPPPNAGLPIPDGTLPIADIVKAIIDRADELGLRWRLVPATVSEPGPNGQVRVVYDGDTEDIDAVTMIGRLPAGARVFVVVSPPAGVHVVGFMGYDPPAYYDGEAIGRSRLIVLGADFPTPASSTTSQDVTGMSFEVGAGQKYIVRLRASVGGSGSADAKISWSGPSGAVMARYVLSIPPAETVNQAATTFTSIRRGLATEQPTAITSTGAGGSTDSTAFPGYWEDVILRVGDTGGTIQLRIGQQASNATPTVLRSDTYIEVQQYR
jgi:hypothetical protein